MGEITIFGEDTEEFVSDLAENSDDVVFFEAEEED